MNKDLSLVAFPHFLTEQKYKSTERETWVSKILCCVHISFFAPQWQSIYCLRMQRMLSILTYSINERAPTNKKNKVFVLHDTFRLRKLAFLLPVLGLHLQGP